MDIAACTTRPSLDARERSFDERSKPVHAKRFSRNLLVASGGRPPVRLVEERDEFLSVDGDPIIVGVTRNPRVRFTCDYAEAKTPPNTERAIAPTGVVGERQPKWADAPERQGKRHL